jgi:nitrate reductase (cytochrome), electron transfer subunit
VPPTEPPQATLTIRATQLFLAAVIGVAFIGFIVGIRQGVPTHEPPEFPLAEPVRDPVAGVVPATSYAEFDRRLYGPNRDWRSTLEDLEQPEVDLFAPVHWDERTRRELLEARARRRAFDGAPPVVPHPIDQMSSTSCMACHGQGLFIAEAYAPKMSHEFMHNCTQCHVEQWAPDLAPAVEVSNVFLGLEARGAGERAWPGAPPTIPHPTFMRENCMACHGPAGPEPIRTTHPWQTNCMQCHAPSAVLDQGVVPVEPDPAFLPPPRIEGP